MHKNKNKHFRRIGISCGTFAGLMVSANVHADFILDGAPDNASPTFSGASVVHGNHLITDQTPFVYERVNDPDTNLSYYHMILGAPADGFAQEVYIRVGGACASCQNFGDIGSTGSASGGHADDVNGNGSDPFGTGLDPLGNPRNESTTFTGIASGNPRRVSMGQVVIDGDFSTEFMKNKDLEKPTMSMNINSADFQSEFIVDAGGISYDDDRTTAAITNTVHIVDPDMDPSSASFDMATDAQDSNVTAGRYTHSPGPGTGAYGTYAYLLDSFNVGNISWPDYFDTSQANPWAFPANHP